jgi:basic membrane protein A
MTLGVLLAATGCKRSTEPGIAEGERPLLVGLVTDVGGRGDQSFNDSALRGLEAWAAGLAPQGGKYRALTPEERAALVPPALAARVRALPVRPLVVQSKAQEDYEPNLQLLVDHGADLTIGVGFMLENAIEAAAKENPREKFLLIDSPLLDAKGRPYTRPNVRTVVFREEEGSFLAGALAGLVARERACFVGGMEIPLIKKFEVGYRAGVRTTNPKATVMVQYTGSFDNVAHGKQVAQDLVAKGCEVLFQAAGADGLGAIQAVREARQAGRSAFAIGVDSDQWHLALEAVLTSMEKRVDLAVWQAISDLKAGTFTTGDTAFGLKEDGVTLSPVRVPLEDREAKLARVDALRALVVSGALRVPASMAELDAFTPPATP